MPAARRPIVVLLPVREHLMDHEKIKYMRKRAMEHEIRAQAAVDPRVAAVHKDLAGRYDAETITERDSYVDEKPDASN